MGYTNSEIEEAQERWNVCFPPDLRALLLEQRLLLDRPPLSFDWLLSEPELIKSRLDWPLESFWSDVENNEVWWPEWGLRPPIVTERYGRFKEIFASAPRLIPLYGHRYIPQEPCESGNPIFSVHQTDVICYGVDLEDWVRRELGGFGVDPWGPVKEIPFWSEAVRKNNAGP